MNPKLKYELIKSAVFICWVTILSVVYYLIDSYTTATTVFLLIYFCLAVASIIALQLIFKFVFDKKMNAYVTDREKLANKITNIVMIVALSAAICGGIIYALLA